MCSASAPTACSAARARTPKSVPGNDAGGRVRAQQAGFTLIELLVVITLIAIASSVVTLAMRDPAATRLEQEAARLGALLEMARAESRAAGLQARWEPRAEQADLPGFRFLGFPDASRMPSAWLGAGVSAEVAGARAV